MKVISIIAVLIIFAALFLSLSQIWFPFLGADTFVKVIVTLGLLLGGVTVIGLICREYFSEKQMRKDKFLD